MLIAVYGTLKRGHRANYMMAGEYIGSGITKESFNMWDVGYPYIRQESTGHPVSVDVYDIVDECVLDRLDNYEGYPSHYQKELVNVVVGSETLEAVTVYTAEDPSGTAVLPEEGVLTW